MLEYTFKVTQIEKYGEYCFPCSFVFLVKLVIGNDYRLHVVIYMYIIPGYIPKSRSAVWIIGDVSTKHIAGESDKHLFTTNSTLHSCLFIVQIN